MSKYNIRKSQEPKYAVMVMTEYDKKKAAQEECPHPKYYVVCSTCKKILGSEKTCVLHDEDVEEVLL